MGNVTKNGDIAISVNNISKNFKVRYDGGGLKGLFTAKQRKRKEVHQVLKGISFQVKKGEAIGIIGKNGCGKSTTLKMLTRIMYPDTGTIDVRGRVSALIELGAGFHPDMTGRENIYTNASIFGLTKKEGVNCIDDVIEFSELGGFIDNPVRTYSSGMYMRLAFSVAINVKAEVLLVDEILAVGDVAFQAKCFKKLREIKGQGTTIVIVSHSLEQIEQICDRSIWIKDGLIEMEGFPYDVHPAYMQWMSEQSRNSKNADLSAGPLPGASPANSNRWGTGEAVITGIRLLNGEGEETDSFCTGDRMEIVIDYKSNTYLETGIAGMALFRNDGVLCYGANTTTDKKNNIDLNKGSRIICSIEKNMLLPGGYYIDVTLHSADNFAYDYCRFARYFTMHSGMGDSGVTRIAHKWELQ